MTHDLLRKVPSPDSQADADEVTTVQHTFTFRSYDVALSAHTVRKSTQRKREGWEGALTIRLEPLVVLVYSCRPSSLLSQLKLIFVKTQ